jgi:hypothetical protein
VIREERAFKIFQASVNEGFGLFAHRLKLFDKIAWIATRVSSRRTDVNEWGIGLGAKSFALCSVSGLLIVEMLRGHNVVP